VQELVFREAHIKLVNLIKHHVNLKRIRFLKKSSVQGVHGFYNTKFQLYYISLPFTVVWAINSELI